MDIHELSERLADCIFPHYTDWEKKEKLRTLLEQFANEITRQSIEP